MDAGLPSYEAIPIFLNVILLCLKELQNQRAKAMLPLASSGRSYPSGLKWTRTTDLTLIRRAL